MNLVRAYAIALKTLRSLKHDRRTAGFLVLMPLFMIAIFGYTFGGDIKDVDVVVVDLDAGSANGSVAALIREDLAGRDVLRIGTSEDRDEGMNAVKDGEAWAAIIFAPEFTVRVEEAIEASRTGSSAAPATVEVHIDASNPNIAQAVVAELQTAVQAVLVGYYGANPAITVSEDRIYGEDAEFIDFFAPGVMGLAAMMITFMLSIISFVRERSTGTLDRLLATPATEGEIVGGYALAFGLVALVQSAVILAAAMLLFQVSIAGNALLVLLTIFLLGIGSQGLGFLLSSIAKNEFQAVQFTPLILFPSILLAGVFWPLEAVPDLLRPVSDFIPLTYAVDACRSVMIRGWDAGEIWPQLVVLAGFAAGTLLLSAYSLKKRG
ncbi:MAG: ABC transporter permease [Methanobacteriota archaeon]|nr:MAG: ABC transporter permease [Euryarchaeota archaeon]